MYKRQVIAVGTVFVIALVKEDPTTYGLKLIEARNCLLYTSVKSLAAIAKIEDGKVTFGESV